MPMPVGSQAAIAPFSVPQSGGNQSLQVVPTVLLGLQRTPGLVGVLSCTSQPTGGGSPTLDVWVQMSPDGGTTWQDIAAQRFTTSNLSKIFGISGVLTGAVAFITASDGALASGTVVQGPFGDRLRLKYTANFDVATGGQYTFALTVVPCGAA